jgi:hypothetical protein
VTYRLGSPLFLITVDDAGNVGSPVTISGDRFFPKVAGDADGWGVAWAQLDDLASFIEIFFAHVDDTGVASSRTQITFGNDSVTRPAFDIGRTDEGLFVVVACVDDQVNGDTALVTMSVADDGTFTTHDLERPSSCVVTGDTGVVCLATDDDRLWLAVHTLQQSGLASVPAVTVYLLDAGGLVVDGPVNLSVGSANAGAPVPEQIPLGNVGQELQLGAAFLDDDDVSGGSKPQLYFARARGL